MTLAAGQRLGPYEILGKLGEGGMGEVYRARDTRLGREVAVKVSREQFSERFDREAHAISSLNHPNICALYDVGPDYLVMEYVEGESPRGPMPVDEALAIGMQIADALREAHDKGIVHRDLKPANIRITPDGKVKVLDFGLAKLGGTPTASSDNSPTISLGGTQAGVILGTAAYMAPEQARGKPVDTRADIWAFGVVLYELITGQRLFKGEDLTETLASVVKEQPDLSRVPPRVRRLLEACLQKDPKKRLQSIGDAGLLLQDESTAAAPSRGGVGMLTTVAIATVAVLATVAAAGLAYVRLRETPPVENSLLLSVSLPEESRVGFFEISPDGRRLVMSLATQAGSQLYTRSLAADDLRPLAGTANAREPFWSADSRFIGFFADSKLKIIPSAGGPTQVLCEDTGQGTGGTWSRAGVILFGGGSIGQLRRVNATGGECTVVGTLDRNLFARSPVFLPDGDHFFYYGGKQSDRSSTGAYLASLEEPIGRRVLADLSSVVYAPPTKPGGRAHLLFLREGTLMAQPFDEASQQLVGDPFALASRASFTIDQWHVAASASTDGTVVYLSGDSRDTQFTWFDRTGKAGDTVGPKGSLAGVSLSPDGHLVAITRREPNDPAVLWVHDLVRGSASRLTPPGSPASPTALWSPDSSRIWFSMTTSEGPARYQKDFGSGQLERLEKIDPTAISRSATDRSRDGRFVIYTTRSDIWYAPVADSGTFDEKRAVRLLGTDAIESQGQLSPDGKWLAYTSNESGPYEVYVRPFPTGSSVWKVSNGESAEPRWRADGKELFFSTLSRPPQMTMRAAPIESDGRAGLRIGAPQTMFDFRAIGFLPQSNIWSYSPQPDGQRFLVNALTEVGTPTLNVITHWQQAVAGAIVGP